MRGLLMSIFGARVEEHLLSISWLSTQRVISKRLKFVGSVAHLVESEERSLHDLKRRLARIGEQAQLEFRATEDGLRKVVAQRWGEHFSLEDVINFNPTAFSLGSGSAGDALPSIISRFHLDSVSFEAAMDEVNEKIGDTLWEGSLSGSLERVISLSVIWRSNVELDFTELFEVRREIFNSRRTYPKWIFKLPGLADLKTCDPSDLGEELLERNRWDVAIRLVNELLIEALPNRSINFYAHPARGGGLGTRAYNIGRESSH